MTGAPARPPTIFRRHLATNAVDDPAALVALACDESIVVRRAAAGNPATPRWVIDLLVRAGADEHLRGRATADPAMGADELRRLVECGPWAQTLVVDHPNTPADVLDALAGQPSRRTREAVARHPHAGASTVGRLLTDPEVGVRRAAATHPARPDAVYFRLRSAGADAALDDLDPNGTSDDLGRTELRALAAMGPWGSFLASQHPCCPPEVLDSVAALPDWRLQSGIFANPATSDTALARVAELDDVGNSDELSNELRSLRVLADPAATSTELATIVDHRRTAVRLAVARHPSVDGGLAARLATDSSAEIRRIAARHPLIDPSEVDVLVRAGSSRDLMRLADPDPDLSTVSIDRLASGGRWARQLAVRHPATSAGTLARLMCDDDPKLREWAAAHPAAPRDVRADIRRAGGADDFQGIAEPDPHAPPDMLRRVAALGPWGALIVSWHPNAPADLARSSRPEATSTPTM